MNYRKLSNSELVDLASKLKYLDSIPVKEICEGIVKFWGEKSAKAILDYCDEYNDSSYDLRLSQITVCDEFGAEIERIVPADDKYDESYGDWKYSIGDLGSESYDGDREVSGIVIDIKSQTIAGIPDLYIKE